MAQMTLKKDISIIITTYNAMPWIEQCLDSCGNYKIIVVDNASSDDTVSYVKNRFPQVIVLEQTINLGFGQANNLGISYALNHGMEYVFLLNQDAYLKPGTIQSMVEVAENNTVYGILSPLHFNGAETQLDSNFLQFIERSNTHSLLLTDYVQKNLKEIYDTKFVNAAAWLLSKKLLLAVGGFDPLFFHYGEDRNFCQRVLYHGFKIGIVPNAIVLHDRENRKKKNSPKFSSDYYLEFEKYMKIELGDVNEKEIQLLLHQKLGKLKQDSFKNLLRFNLKYFKDSKAKYHIIKKLQHDIRGSRSLNIKRQANYLTLDI